MRAEFLESGRSVLFWKRWRRKPARKPPARATITETQRHSYRASVEFGVVYTLDGRDGARTATAGELSAGGLRIIGDEDLPDETMLDLRFTFPNDLIQQIQMEKEIVETTPRGRTTKKVMVPPDPFREISIRAKVVIAFLDARRKKFAHSVQFVEIDDRTQEEIQRFIHVWQIKLLRERRALRGE